MGFGNIFIAMTSPFYKLARPSKKRNRLSLSLSNPLIYQKEVVKESGRGTKQSSPNGASAGCLVL